MLETIFMVAFVVVVVVVCLCGEAHESSVSFDKLMFPKD